MRIRLQLAARKIADNRNQPPTSQLVALRKLLLQERRDWTKTSAPRIGWKRGEIFEVANALITANSVTIEWGDIGYYVAQTWWWLWALYAAVTPTSIIKDAVVKFERRARCGLRYE